MHPMLEVLDGELVKIINSLNTTILNDEPLNITHGMWNMPGTTKNELVNIVEALRLTISERGSNELVRGEALIADYQRRLDFLRSNTIPQIWGGNGGAAILAFTATIQGLQLAIEKALPENQDIAQVVAQAIRNAKLATNRLRALETRINNLEPRSASLNEMVGRIEAANDAADQLPIDIEALREARETIKGFLADISADRSSVGKLAADADLDKITLRQR